MSAEKIVNLEFKTRQKIYIVRDYNIHFKLVQKLYFVRINLNNLRNFKWINQSVVMCRHVKICIYVSVTCIFKNH